MPKMKTKRGAAKRFSVTGSGKVRRRKAYLRHILTSKTKKQKRHLRKAAIVDGTNAKSIRRLVPYL
jgi:large subunit ribosomal protein L35